MKYFLRTFALIITLFSLYSFAQADTLIMPPNVKTPATSCTVVTSATVDVCCTNADTNAQRQACEDYYNNPQPSPQQINGGTQQTNALNTASSYSLAPSAADAKTATSCSKIQFKTLLDIAIWAKCIIGSIVIPGIFSLAFLFFLWGVFKFMRASEEKDKKESKQYIYMGLIGLFVMVSVWGIISIITTTFGVGTVVPTLQTDYLDTSKASK